VYEKRKTSWSYTNEYLWMTKKRTILGNISACSQREIDIKYLQSAKANFIWHLMMLKLYEKRKTSWSYKNEYLWMTKKRTILGKLSACCQMAIDIKYLQSAKIIQYSKPSNRNKKFEHSENFLFPYEV